MASWNYFAVMAAALITFLSTAEGFFLYSSNKKTEKRTTHSPQVGEALEVGLNCRSPPFQVTGGFRSTDRQFPPPPNYYRDAIQMPANNWGAQYAFDGAGSMTVALPVAVPIQAQMAQVPPSLKGTVHNVQLVPCLCPVSKDDDSSFIGRLGQQPPQQSSSGYVLQAQQSQTQTT